VRNDHLGPDYPPFDYEKNGNQIMIILNEDNNQIKAILDHNSTTGFADRYCPVFEATMMEAGQWAVNREQGKTSESEWNKFVELHGGLSSEAELINLNQLKKAI
jgi:hypothetical protein